MTNYRLAILIEARRRIEFEENAYICAAVGAAKHAFNFAPDWRDYSRAARELAEEISEDCDDDLNWWTLEALGLGVGHPDRPQPYQTLADSNGGVSRMCRLAWIDRLIEDSK